MSTIKQAAEFIRAKLDEEEKAKTAWKDLLSAAEDQKEKAAAETTKTYAAADPKAYHRAQDDFRTAADAINMYSDKLQQLKDAPLISKEEFQAKHDEIIEALDAVNLDARERIAQIIIDQIFPIIDETAETIKVGNALLDSLQIDLLKDRRAAEIPSLINHYNDRSVIGHRPFFERIAAQN